MKIVFFLVTILLGLFFSRGRLVFDDNQYLMIQKITMPGYMILCGIMVGYLIGSLRLSRYDDTTNKTNSIYATALVFGLVLGTALALINIYYVI
ncbi:MAG: hypothetical protein WC004_03195 [Candidatus Absconditabacterales bacterium]